MEDLDKLLKAKNLVKGLFETMICMEMAEQDKMIPIAVLCSFEAVLEKACLLLEEVEERVAGYDK